VEGKKWKIGRCEGVKVRGNMNSECGIRKEKREEVKG
jgi:hypothetical protein